MSKKNPPGYLGLLRPGDVVEEVEKKEIPKEELEELRSRIEAGEILSDKEMDRCSIDLLQKYLELRGHTIY